MKYRVLHNGIMIKEITTDEYGLLSENEKQDCIEIHEDALPDPYYIEEAEAIKEEDKQNG